MDRNKDHLAFAPLYFPMELHRKKALIRDMEYFFGEDWEEQVQCSQATQKYVERIHCVGQNEPELLVAHAYTRYMGDLSGGQVLKKVAQRALKLPSTGEGTQFYLFENIDNAQQFKQFYRARMNALDLDLKTKEKIVEEANKAFEYNMQVMMRVGRQACGLKRHNRPPMEMWFAPAGSPACPGRELRSSKSRAFPQHQESRSGNVWYSLMLHACGPLDTMPWTH